VCSCAWFGIRGAVVRSEGKGGGGSTHRYISSKSSCGVAGGTRTMPSPVLSKLAPTSTHAHAPCLSFHEGGSGLDQPLEIVDGQSFGHVAGATIRHSIVNCAKSTGIVPVLQRNLMSRWCRMAISDNYHGHAAASRPLLHCVTGSTVFGRISGVGSLYSVGTEDTRAHSARCTFRMHRVEWVQRVGNCK